MWPKWHGPNFAIPLCRQPVNRLPPRLVMIIPPHPSSILVAPPGSGSTNPKRVRVIPPFRLRTALTVLQRRLHALFYLMTSRLVLGLLTILSLGTQLVTPLTPVRWAAITPRRPMGLAETVSALQLPLRLFR